MTPPTCTDVLNGPRPECRSPRHDLAIHVAASLRATSFRCPIALGKQVLEEDALEAFQRDGAALRLCHENGALKRADDETCKLLYLRVGRQLARVDRGFQAVGYRCLVLREHRGDTSANRLAFLAGFRAEVSVQAPSTHVVFAKVLELPFHPRTQPAKWRQPVIA